MASGRSSTHFNMDRMLAHLVQRGQTDVVLTTYNFAMQNVAAADQQARKTGRMCGACNGVCEKGVPVPDMLRFLSYAEGYGQFAMARERFLELPKRVRDVRCGECTSCSVNCPNGVQVRGCVMRAQELLA